MSLKARVAGLDDRSLVRLVWVSGGILVASVIALAVYIYADSTRSRDTLLDHETSLIEEQIRQQPANADLRVVAANMYLEKGQYDKAIAQAGEALKVDDRQGEALAVMGLSYKQKGNLAPAARYLEEAVRLGEEGEAPQASRKLAFINYELGDVYLRNGDAEKSIAALKRVLDSDVTDADAYRLLGQAYLSVGQTDEAIASFRRALRYVPDYTEAYQSLQQIWEQTGDTARAGFAKAMLSYAKGDYALAERGLTMAAEALPDMPEIPIGLGMTYEKIGRQDKALEAYRRAQVLDPTSYVAKQALGRLEEK